MATTLNHLGAQFTVGGSSAVDVAPLTDGNWVATWANGADVLVQRWDPAGNALSAAMTVVSNAVGTLAPTVTGLTGNRYLVTWIEQQLDSSGNPTAFVHGAGRIFDGAGAPLTGTFQVTAENPYSMSVSARADGGFLVSIGEMGNVFQTALYDANGIGYSASAAASGYYPESVTLHDAGGVHDGGYATIWVDGLAGSLHLLGRTFNAGGTPAGGVFDLGLADGGLASTGYHAIAALEGGNFVVVKSSHTSEIGPSGAFHYDLIAQVFDYSGVAVGPSFIVNTSQVPLDPDVAALPGGGFVVAWEGDPNEVTGRMDIVARAFDSAGNAVTPEVSVPTTYDGGMSLPDIAVLAGGAIVVGWQGVSATAEILQLGPEVTQNQVLQGTPGSDYLYGGAGNDRLYGSGNLDVLFGGSGNDRYYVLAGDRVVEHAGEGVDTVYVLGGNFSLQAGSEVENIRASAGASGLVLTGNEFANAIYGGIGDDILDGGSGADLMAGGAGNDTYYRDNSGDIIVEKAGEGADTVFASVTTKLSANVEKLILTGSSAINGTGNELDNEILGNSGANSLSGGDGNDILNGGMGGDRMAGGLGNDIYYRDDANDVIVEKAGEGTDSVFASITTKLATNVENLTLTGATDINGTGNALNNTIVGNSAANVINGREGTDSLTGGGGYDVFVFQPGEMHGDIITDFDGRGAFAGDRIKLVGFGTAADVMIVERAPLAGMPVGTRGWEACYGPHFSIHETVYFTNGASLDVQHDLIYV